MGSTLSLSVVRLLVSVPGEDSVLPILHGLDPLPDMDEDMAYGRPATLLPYHAQDGYGREPVERDCDVAVLENELLTATFLLGYGGRLWSLVDRLAGRELLHQPEVLQLGNLGLRNAWFAGGVEWNFGTTGHWPLTCSPMHAGTLTTPDGTPVLRMWEHERMRRLVTRIDAWLPAGSPVLYVRPRLHNPHPVQVPVYWWSNMAVPEADGVRVIAPAESALHFGYDSTLRQVPFPEWRGLDRSYPTKADTCADYFFDVAEPWIAAVDQRGEGVVQISTATQRGRKLFAWGTGTGGRHWQEWLGGYRRYFEIQAGLARTQLEHRSLPADLTWSWTEAYGPIAADPVAAHSDWDRAVAAVSDALPAVDLAGIDAAAEAWADEPPTQLVSTGSGWGALEIRTGDLPAYPGTPFPSSTLGASQEPWTRLLKDGVLPESEPPAPAVTGPHWRRLLERHASDWHALLQLGLVRLADGDVAGARQAWDASLGLKVSPWTLRCLGELDRVQGKPHDGADRMLAAVLMCPGHRQVTIEALAALVAAGRAPEALAVVDSLPDEDRRHGRIRFLECRAALQAGNVARARRIMRETIEIADVREGEDSLDVLWFAYQRAIGSAEPLPYSYDFRMGPAIPRQEERTRS